MSSSSIPESLDDWTLEFIQNIIARGFVENEMLDFKLSLPDADTLTELCCSFANSNGGYIVFGVKQKTKFIIEGIPYDTEFARNFGDKLRTNPPISYPPPKFIKFKDSKFVIAFHIPKSESRPHVHRDLQKMRFLKRTNKGKELMTLDEIRNQFEQPLNKKIIDLTDLLQSSYLAEKERRIRHKTYFIRRIKAHHNRLVKGYEKFDATLSEWMSDEYDKEKMKKLERSTDSLLLSIDAFWPVAEGDFKEIQEMVDNPRLKDKFVFIVGTSLNFIKGYLNNKTKNSISFYTLEHNREDIKLWMESIQEFISLLNEEVQ